MKRMFAVVMLLLAVAFVTTPGQSQPGVPTLVPPTPIPQPATDADPPLPGQSTIARIRETNVLNVGYLYNEPPFSELNVRGRVSGFDADIANSIASLWGVDTNPVQITRGPQEMARMLADGEIDIVMGGLVHQRDYDAFMEFSQTYHTGRKTIMVLTDDPAQAISDFGARPLGVVLASPAEVALNRWLGRTGAPAEVVTYWTLDRAYAALASGEISGVVDSEHRLLRISSEQPNAIRLLAGVIEPEPYAIGFLQQDASMRDLVNASLHYLMANGRMNEIQQVHFPGEPDDVVRVWAGLGEVEPQPSQYETTLVYPTQYVLPRIQGNGTIRVAGLYDRDEAPTNRATRLDAFHRRLIDALAARWGVTVDYIPASASNALDLVANGQADIAVGVEPNWDWATRVDFVEPYLVHGYRLMVRENDSVRGFTDLTGDLVAIPNNDPAAPDQVRAIAESVNTPIEIVQPREEDLGFIVLNEGEDGDVAFGDSIALVAHVQANPDTLRLTLTPETEEPRWYNPALVANQDYGPRLMAIAVPQNDLEFRLLVTYTMQEIAEEGLLVDWLAPLSLAEDIPAFEIWPGDSIFAGINLGG
jgi:ABC-type amino acid transport substrate-binding protein